MLLQVQWVPRDAGEPEPLVDIVENVDDDAVCFFFLMHRGVG